MVRAAALSCLFGLLCVVPVSGHVSVPAGFREIVADAAMIVRGRVTDVRAEDVPGVGVESIVTVAVERVLKGEAGPFVSFRVPGGRIGRYAVVMIGSPTFTRDEEAVFFLKRGADQAIRPVGLTAGVVRIRAGGSRGEAVVQAPFLPVSPAADGRAAGDDRRRAPLALGTFEALVRLVDVEQRRAAGAAR